MKTERHAKIKELLRRQAVCTQRDLTRLLKEAGFDVTQATVSRDIRELRLTKAVDADGASRYALSRDDDGRDMAKHRRVFDDGFVSMDYAGHMLVIHTGSGMAGAVGAALDAMAFPEVLGSVAGDDVLLCVVRRDSQAPALMRKLRP